MPSGVKEIQLLELKDMISQLNNTIHAQNELIRSLQKMLQDRESKDSENDQLIANLQAQLDYLKNKLFGSTSEIRHDQLPGQLNLFQTEAEDEPEPVPLEVECVEVKAHKKVRKPLMMRSLQIFRPKTSMSILCPKSRKHALSAEPLWFPSVMNSSGQNCVIQNQSWNALIIMRPPMNARNAKKQKNPNSSRMKENLH